MTQFIPMRTTDPPLPAPRPAAGARLCHSQNIALYTQGLSTEDSGPGPAGGPSMVSMTPIDWATGAFRSHPSSQIPIGL